MVDVNLLSSAYFCIILTLVIIGSYSATSTKTDTETCGKFKAVDKIVGGNTTVLGEFPWAVLLIYADAQLNFTILCDGSIINRRYVLTAAHCVINKETKKKRPLVRVRIGEYNLAKDVDCMEIHEKEVCAPPHKDIEIDFVHPHPNYTHHHNDIALVRLLEEVNFGEYVKPICLPSEATLKRIGEGNTEFTVAGWGKTEHDESSMILLKAEIHLFDSALCSEEQICAGGGKNDTCSGDSGGPLMFLDKNPTDKKLHWYLVGITSYGPEQCGSEGMPAVYTKTNSHLEWIYSTMKL